MTSKRIWKPNLYRLGLLLTLAVIAADWGQWLNAPERLLYDRRARWCQRFLIPPTNQLIHIDIDDDSIAEIGQWPWPRAYLARIIDEISLAGPKVIGLDMFFPNPQPLGGEARPDGLLSPVNNDELFAESLRRAGNVLVPVSVAFEIPQKSDPVLDEMIRVLRADLELGEDEVFAAVQQRGIKSASLARDIHDYMRQAREEAILARLETEVSGQVDLPALRRRLVPRAEASGIRSDASQLLEKLVPRVSGVKAAMRFRQPLMPELPLLTAPTEYAWNLPQFSAAARYSGFVDLVRLRDGVVRSVPLLINYRGGTFPHMSLAMACAMLDVDLRDIRCTEDQIVLPIPNQPAIVIPVHAETSSNYGRVGALMNIPWFGKDDWRTMYDYPNFEKAVAHKPASVIWTIAQLAGSIHANNRTADQALKDVAQVAAPQAAERYLKNVPDLADTDARLAAIAATLKELDEMGFGELLKKRDTELGNDEKAAVAPIRALQSIQRINQEKVQQLTRERAVLRSEFHGKAILVNWTATGAIDYYTTSLHPQCPGAVIQGVIFSGILSRNQYRLAPQWVTALITFGVGLLTTILVALLPPWRALIFTFLIMAGYALANGELLYDYGHQIVGAAGPLAACALVWMGLTLTNFITEARERRRIRQRFSSYVDPALVDWVEEHPELARLDGERREMTVVFTDLAGFTTISEKLGESTVSLLNEYFGKMVPVIRENRGYVNKFLGDGLMFFYNAPRLNPNHAVDAVQTILQMRQVLVGFNESLKQRGLPFVGMRAGMTTGHMLVGDAGSRAEDERHNANDYTVLGDRVNLAARLEAANKFFGTSLLMIERTREMLGGRFLLRPVGKIVVAGKSEDVMTYEMICGMAEATEAQLLHAALSAKVVESFQAGEFDDCLLLCDELEQKTGDSKFAATYRKLCTKHLSTAFEGVFSGQIVLTEK